MPALCNHTEKGMLKGFLTRSRGLTLKGCGHLDVILKDLAEMSVDFH